MFLVVFVVVVVGAVPSLVGAAAAALVILQLTSSLGVDYDIFRNPILCHTIILAHGIRISEVLPWDRNSYLTHAILPRLSREGSVR